MRCDLLAALAAIGIERGCHDEADEALGAVILADSAPSPATGSLRIAAALARSATDVAMAVATEVEAQPIGVAAPGICWRPWAALARHAGGDAPGALALAGAHLEHRRAWGAPSLLGRALVVRGLVDKGVERVTLIKEGLAVLERTPARLEFARATIEPGVALRRERRRS